MDYAAVAWANEAPVAHIAAYYERMRLARLAVVGQQLAKQAIKPKLYETNSRRDDKRGNLLYGYNADNAS